MVNQSRFVTFIGEMIKGRGLTGACVSVLCDGSFTQDDVNCHGIGCPMVLRLFWSSPGAISSKGEKFLSGDSNIREAELSVKKE
jgi:hypothetical protein